MTSVVTFPRRSTAYAKKYFTLSDDSMCRDGYGPRKGDLALCEVGNNLNFGPHIVKSPGGFYHCKVVSFKDGNLILSSENPDYPAISGSGYELVGRVSLFYVSMAPMSLPLLTAVG